MLRTHITLVALVLGVVVGFGGIRMYEAGYLTGCKADHMASGLRDGMYRIYRGTTTTVRDGVATTCSEKRFW
jgi:hypothetical protein